MPIFSKRYKLKKEHSGHEEASQGLRNRLLNLYGQPFSGDEFGFGIGNTDWIHERAFSKDLQMHFGRKIHINDFKDLGVTSYDEVFDFIEIYYHRAEQDLDYNKRLLLLQRIQEAFINSGSVYGFTSDGEVELEIDEDFAVKIAEVDKLLDSLSQSQEKYRKLIDGLVSRQIDPADAIGDIFIIFEDYCKDKTRRDSFEDSLKDMSNKIPLHPTQRTIIEKLKAYRGDVFGAAHAGKGAKPGEKEALWYLQTTMDQILYIERSIK